MRQPAVFCCMHQLSDNIDMATRTAQGAISVRTVRRPACVWPDEEAISKSCAPFLGASCRMSSAPADGGSRTYSSGEVGNSSHHNAGVGSRIKESNWVSDWPACKCQTWDNPVRIASGSLLQHDTDKAEKRAHYTPCRLHALCLLKTLCPHLETPPLA